MLNTVISVDIVSNGDGTYATYISHEGSSGASYDALSANAIGEYVAEYIDVLEEADSGNSYLLNR